MSCDFWTSEVVMKSLNIWQDTCLIKKKGGLGLRRNTKNFFKGLNEFVRAKHLSKLVGY